MNALHGARTAQVPPQRLQRGVGLVCAEDAVVYPEVGAECLPRPGQDGVEHLPPGRRTLGSYGLMIGW